MNFLRVAVLVSSVLLVLSSPIPQRNPEEEGNLFEGDIAGIEKDAKGAFQIPTLTRKLWPNGVVPYMIDPAGGYSTTELNNIAAGLKNIEDSTKIHGEKIINFVKLEPETPSSELPSVYIKIIRDSGCWSYVGKNALSGVQNLSLGTNCATLGTTAHEFMHALGWWHEQSRTDRDDYVTIVTENIREGTEHNFNKYTSAQVGLLDMEYDYGSVMHYSSTAFSVNGEATIVPKVPGVTIGQRNGLSVQDALEIMRIYGPQRGFDV